MIVRIGVEARRKITGDVMPIERCPSTSFENRHRIVVDVEGALRREQHMRVAHLIEMQAHATRGSFGYAGAGDLGHSAADLPLRRRSAAVPVTMAPAATRRAG